MPTLVQEKNPYATNGTLVLNNPLTDGNGSWQQGTMIANGGTCALTNSTGYVVTAPIIDPGECIEQQHTYTNFTYEVTMKFAAIKQLYSGGGITFRSSSDDRQYYYFELFRNGLIRFRSVTQVTVPGPLTATNSTSQAFLRFTQASARPTC